MKGDIIGMENTGFRTRSSEIPGDLQIWIQDHAGDNSEQIDRLRRNLRKARKQELTPRQAQMLRLYFDEGENMTQIAQKLGINRSTVSRTISRAKARLYRCLRYTF